MLSAPTRVYAYETADNVHELSEKSASRVAEGWEIFEAPRVSQVRVVNGSVLLLYRQQYLKFIDRVSPAGWVSSM